MRIVVLGANGQLGRELCQRLPGEVLPLERRQADLTQPATLQEAMATLAPTLMINCAAYNFVDRAESEPEAAFAANTWGVRHLAQLCRQRNITLVHFSSDHVFGLDTTRQTPLAETDPPGPVNIYGLSKLSGEYLVRALVPKFFIIRTCGLYGVWGSGGKGGNFVETMLRLAGQDKPLRVVADQCCTPTYTVDLAQAVVALIQTQKFGLYHLTNSGSCSWHEFAQAIMAQAGLTVQVQPITSKEFAAPACRPNYSVLANKRLVEIGLSPLRHWRAALAAYCHERQAK